MNPNKRLPKFLTYALVALGMVVLGMITDECATEMRTAAMAAMLVFVGLAIADAVENA